MTFSKMSVLKVLVVSCALFFAACGDSDDDANNANNVNNHNNHNNVNNTNNHNNANNTNNEHQAFMFEATLDPETAVVGDHAMTISIVDMEDEPVVGATLTVTPWMPHHGHGSPSTPVITDNGDGTYTADPVEFTMPGMWEVTVTAMEGDVEAEHVFMYEI